MIFENTPIAIETATIAEFEALTGDDFERYAEHMLPVLRAKYPVLSVRELTQKLAATMQKEIDICKGVL